MRSAGVIVWQRIADELAEEIQTGVLETGTRLPSEDALAARFGVNRHTLRRAVAALASAGLVSVEQGRGTFVRSVPPLDYRLGRRTRFSQIVSRQSRLPDGELLRAAHAPAERDVAGALGIEPGTELVVLEILRSVDLIPISLGTVHFPAARFAGIGEAYRRTRSITAALRQFGVADYTRRSTRILARLPAQGEAALLRQLPTRPVLVTEAVDVDEAGVAILCGITRSAAERLQLIVES